jgi:hypothetical protein
LRKTDLLRVTIHLPDREIAGFTADYRTSRRLGPLHYNLLIFGRSHHKSIEWVLNEFEEASGRVPLLERGDLKTAFEMSTAADFQFEGSTFHDAHSLIFNWTRNTDAESSFRPTLPIWYPAI